MIISVLKFQMKAENSEIDTKEYKNDNSRFSVFLSYLK